MWPVIQQTLVNQDQLSELRAQNLQQLGKEIELTERNVRRTGIVQAYERLAKFDKIAGQVDVQFAFDPRGNVADFAVRSLNA